MNNGGNGPFWLHGMDEDEWTRYRPPSWSEHVARSSLMDDTTDDPGAGEPTWMRRVLARVSGLIGRWK